MEDFLKGCVGMFIFGEFGEVTYLWDWGNIPIYEITIFVVINHKTV